MPFLFKLPSSISNSSFSNDTVWSVFIFRMSETFRNIGLSPTITQAFGEIVTWQSVNAYNASIVLSGDTSGWRWIRISTLSEVLSSIFLILIFPFSFALIILSIRSPVVLEKGSSVTISVCLSFWVILALALTLPPRCPSLYSETSSRPSVRKSGNTWKGFFFQVSNRCVD